MNGWLRSLVTALAFAALSTSMPLALAAPATTEAELRTQMTEERRQIEATHVARERQCAAQFAVTACVEASQARRREALAALDVRAAALDDNERKQRATDRLARIDAKVASRAASAPERAPLALVPNEAASRARPTLLRSPAPASAPRRAVPPDASDVKAREDGASARFDEQAREAQQKKRAANERQVQRQQSGRPPATALPPVGPSAASGVAPPR